MSLKKFKPTTPGQRHKVALEFKGITASTPEKSLVSSMKKSGGRNNDGRMTMRYIGGGHKQKYRIIDFKRDKFDIPATVKTIEYDPNRTANIALLFYADGEKRYIIAPNGMKVGDQILSGKTATPNIGNAMYLSDIYTIGFSLGELPTLTSPIGTETGVQITADKKQEETILSFAKFLAEIL